MKLLIRIVACLALTLLAACGTMFEDSNCSTPAPDDGCNSCACDDGEWVCTDMICEEICSAGDTKTAPDGCNTCTCLDDGSWACTEIGCDVACTPGETMPAGDGCNTCACQDDGSWACTLLACEACPVPADTGEACLAQVVYGRTDGGTCCEYPTPCSVPDGLKTFNTEKECVANAPVCPAPLDPTPGLGCPDVITYARTSDGLCCEYASPCIVPAELPQYDTLAECQTGDEQCAEGETKPAGDGCNTCTCQADGSWACTEIACDPGSCETDDDCVVTGCSGQLCARTEMASTCEFLPEYACYREEITSCGCNEGSCGWAQTEALATCLGG